jgi:hypothetical protein
MLQPKTPKALVEKVSNKIPIRPIRGGFEIKQLPVVLNME